MEASSPTRQGLLQLLNEINDCLVRMDESQKNLLSALAEMSPYINLNSSKLNLDPHWHASWKLWKQELGVFFQALRHAQEAYQDLSSQMQSLLADRTTQDPLLQGLANQGAALLKDLQKRQSLAQYIEELFQVLDKSIQQDKISSTQKQKIEDLVFRLHLLF